MKDKRKSAESAVKPQVIDLDASEVVEEVNAPTEAPLETPDIAASGEEPARPSDTESAYVQPDPVPSQPKANKKSSAGLYLPLAALLLGAVGGGWLYRDYLSSYFPADHVTALETRNGEIETTLASAKQQLSALGEQSGTLKADLGKLQNDVATGASGTAALQADVSALKDQITKLQTALKDTNKRMELISTQMNSAVPTPGQPSADPAALNNLNQRIGKLEEEVAALKTTQSGTSEMSRILQTASDLRAKVSAGEPYQSELAPVLAIEPPIEGIDVLQQNAATGLQNASALAEDLRKLAAGLKPAATPAEAPSDNSYTGWFTNLLSGIIKVTPVGSTDWQTAANAAATLAESGKLADAQATIKSAADASGANVPEPLMNWMVKAGQRIELDAAVEKAVAALIHQATVKG